MSLRIAKDASGQYVHTPSMEAKKHKIASFGTRQRVENTAVVERFLRELVADIPPDKKTLEQRKYTFAAAEQLPLIENRDLIAIAQQWEQQGNPVPETLLQLLRKRSVRTISGVSPIGILTKPYPCPGKCVYCPTEDRMPKSYMSNQPAAARALRNKFHPYDQVINRLHALEDSGHPVSKLEVIVMGGTWSFLPKKYQSWYCKKIYDAANDDGRVHATHKSLSASQHANETAARKIIGLTLETRPDFITPKELYRMRQYGCTRIEIGVQTLDDTVQTLTKRGHKKAEVVRAMRLMKDYGFKVCWHLMPGLPGSTPEKDLQWLREVFEDPDCRPDFVKIYPCVVLETAELKQWWQEGRYQPYTDEQLIKLLLQFKTFVPPWTRVMRLMRDIPVTNILDGAKFSNLRQILRSQPEKLREIVGEQWYTAYQAERAEESGSWPCRCIRCREIGFQSFATAAEVPVPVLKRRSYSASGGTEEFLSFESEDEQHLFALLRLRRPSGKSPLLQWEGILGEGCALIREVHSYGSEIAVGDSAGVGQHRGLGTRLMHEAERLAREEWGCHTMTVIAGVGTRDYYRRFGYTLQHTYMVKRLLQSH
ncbi:tRNA uridine(34) 5-carboxymethylaminomethyl modification radical SAM/GNAT enzyme Elp3 [Candidatus Peribacteria bacterium]|nr:tRNA uridine(34) 5-carboxymethylaminomethyl modification radical SAM/GNAT enzyme Elp3 [Candidatus Peribacteria bacterium]